MSGKFHALLIRHRLAGYGEVPKGVQLLILLLSLPNQCLDLPAKPETFDRTVEPGDQNPDQKADDRYEVKGERGSLPAPEFEIQFELHLRRQCRVILHRHDDNQQQNENDDQGPQMFHTSPPAGVFKRLKYGSSFS
ncbi:hypothetical protein TRIP_B330481 [uncultured Desulfatiglans sp.]|nr:hypothetical protein TRIP_B330481 [uncultured Desulfatiglans sp.]